MEVRVAKDYLHIRDWLALALEIVDEGEQAYLTGLSQTRISQMVHGKRAITLDTALRRSRALGVDDRFWINIQNDHDIEVERDLHAC